VEHPRVRRGGGRGSRVVTSLRPAGVLEEYSRDWGRGVHLHILIMHVELDDGRPMSMKCRAPKLHRAPELLD
jgi:hypothetical protein